MSQINIVRFCQSTAAAIWHVRQFALMFFTAARGLLAHAFPILIAQLSSIGMMVVDTAVLGHVSPLELAAVAIGGGIHVSVVFALVGILQAEFFNDTGHVGRCRGVGGDRASGEKAGKLQTGAHAASVVPAG